MRTGEGQYYGVELCYQTVLKGESWNMASNKSGKIPDSKTYGVLLIIN